MIVTRGPRPRPGGASVRLAADVVRGYVGLIGSKRKIRLIFDEPEAESGISAEAALNRVAAPVGLDIGSQTVFEIAVSIVAQLIARRNLGPADSTGVAR